MKLTKPQVWAFWRLWGAACDVQGWASAEREPQRREMLARCGFASLKDVDRRAGFDRVKTECLRLAERLEGGLEATYPGLGEARRHAHIIRSDLMPRLRACGADAEAYVAAIARDRFGMANWEDLSEHAGPGPQRIKQLLFTLTRATRDMEQRLCAQNADGVQAPF
jgi:hypothetical protein